MGFGAPRARLFGRGVLAREAGLPGDLPGLAPADGEWQLVAGVSENADLRPVQVRNAVQTKHRLHHSCRHYWGRRAAQPAHQLGTGAEAPGGLYRLQGTDSRRSGDSERPMPRMRLSAAGQRTAVDGVLQIGGHYVLAFLQGALDPRAACTLAVTPADLYPPENYDYVTGMTDPGDRLGLFSSARYFATHREETQRASVFSEADSLRASESALHGPGPGHSVRNRRIELSKIFAKLLCRETLKLCGAKECRLLHCLMNPMPEIDGQVVPEGISLLPFSLCCICLRKLQWLTQADLLDRYARIPAVTNAWFWEETQWLWTRMVQVGMPTSVCQSIPQPTGSKFKFGLAKRKNDDDEG
ncbi:unnamed protein product [Effrenium voratum]|nr:unnamed protein product [Effrenium voratum]